MSQGKFSITAIVVNFRSLNYLIELIPALLQEDKITKIIVVDNSAHDGAGSAILADFDNVIWIDSGDNIGFARAVNLGLTFVDHEHVLLINPDCMPARGAIDTMARHLESSPRCGIVAPLTRHPDRNLRFLAAGEQPTTRSLFNHYLGLSEVFPRQEWARGWHLRSAHHADRVRAVGWASGSCLLVRSQTLSEVGNLCEDWFMYAEDMEYCLRTTAAGWEIHHIPEAIVTHVIGGSTASTSTRWISVLLDYNRRYLSRSRGASLAARCVLFLGFLVRAAHNAIASLKPDLRSDRREAALNNLRWSWRALTPERRGMASVPPPPRELSNGSQ